MDHVAGAVDLHLAVIGERTITPRAVFAPSLTAVLAVNDQNRAGDAAQKLQRLIRVKGLRRRGPVQGIELPNPFAVDMLSHRGTRQFESKAGRQSRIGLTELARARLDAAVLAKMAATALAHFCDPLCHSLSRVGKAHTDGTNA